MIPSTSIARSSSPLRPNDSSSSHLSSKSEARRVALSALEGLGTGQELEDHRRSPPEQVRDPEGVLLKLIPPDVFSIEKFIEHLTSTENQDSEPHLTAIGYELEALLSIYGGSAVKLSFASRPSSIISSSSLTTHDLPPSLPTPSSVSSRMERRRDSQQYTDALWDLEIGFTPGERIRYEITLPVYEEGESLDGIDPSKLPEKPPTMRILVSLPPTYPNSSPPQLQLLGRYLGSFGIDSGLFGDITRTYISSTGVPFVPGDVCVFDGLTHVQSVVRQWYISHLSSLQEGESARDAERKQNQIQNQNQNQRQAVEEHHLIRGMSTLDINHAEREREYHFPLDTGEIPESSKLKIWTSEPIVDRKSTFVGHAVRVTNEREIPLIIHELLNDKKIAKAAHPAIFAYRLVREVGGAAGKVYENYDDDGETAAGSRLKHLLDILELENVLIVVTRWFGGIHLGPDRFKHINQAARDALELGGFLNEKKEKDEEKSGAKRRGGGRK
ncbi:hypothetical protein L486_03559 [Kwoniella mangroviensis CBS 10435]|uniref:RWD domain-containing protein n=1 Tax=Kwoniella mangroviensis CBS 10435 TaxID=1331196 RepID=A0A1B9IU47_9TREE|nr:uncharacterized protein I203_02247 [Kwoniella mangroviensis CBS 8507]OCF59061.1 hypothetical protein L486_03559 [Kwoniella mangroviensis CBS 10435]OCF68856.1 hypothetical protein I203_02247 [Kwoniella mangroviensis CBS 8507]OCF76684.1 hypothetical protein I204_02385 [Kwoniella mangroviensis CBS 8886]